MSSQQAFNTGYGAYDDTLEDSFDFRGYYGVSADFPSIPGPDVLLTDTNVLSPAQDDYINATSMSTTAASNTFYSMAAEPDGSNFWTTAMDPSFAISPTASSEMMSGGSNLPNGYFGSACNFGMEFNVQEHDYMLPHFNSFVRSQQFDTAQNATFGHDVLQQLVEPYNPAESFSMSSNSIDISTCGQPQGVDAIAPFSEQIQELQLRPVAVQRSREFARTVDMVSVADDHA